MQKKEKKINQDDGIVAPFVATRNLLMIIHVQTLDKILCLLITLKLICTLNIMMLVAYYEHDTFQ